MEAEQAILADPLFQEAVFRHYGVTDMRLVMVDIWSVGFYVGDEGEGAEEESRTLRLSRPLCFMRSDPTDNGYAR